MPKLKSVKETLKEIVSKPKEEVKEKPQHPEGFDPDLPEQKQRWLR